MNKKKIVVIAIIVITFVIIIGLGLYFWVFSAIESSIPVEQKEVEIILENVSFVKTLDDKIFFYNPETSIFEEYNLKNKTRTAITSTPMFLIIEVIWSPEADKAIFKVGNNSALHRQDGIFLDTSIEDGQITTWSYNFISQKLIQLSNNIGGVDWLSNEEIMYHYYTFSFEETESTKAESSLVKSKWNGADHKKIMDLKNILYNSQVLLSPNKKQSLLLPEISGVGNNSFYLLSLKGKSIEEITEDGLTPMAKWSTNEENIIFYKIDDKTYEPYLWMANNKGVDKKNFNIISPYNLAITNSDDQYLLAVVPKNYSVDEETGERSGDDQVYQINTGSIKKKIIFDASEHKNISTITEIGSLENDIFIVSEGNLYKIDI